MNSKECIRKEENISQKKIAKLWEIEIRIEKRVNKSGLRVES